MTPPTHPGPTHCWRRNRDIEEPFVDLDSSDVSMDTKDLVDSTQPITVTVSKPAPGSGTAAALGSSGAAVASCCSGKAGSGSGSSSSSKQQRQAAKAAAQQEAEDEAAAVFQHAAISHAVHDNCC